MELLKLRCFFVKSLAFLFVHMQFRLDLHVILRAQFQIESYQDESTISCMKDAGRYFTNDITFLAYKFVVEKKKQTIK